MTEKTLSEVNLLTKFLLTVAQEKTKNPRKPLFAPRMFIQWGEHPDAFCIEPEPFCYAC
jgi:hypothetical protein